MSHPFDDEAMMAANVAWGDAHRAYVDRGEGGIGFNDGPIAAAVKAAWDHMIGHGKIVSDPETGTFYIVRSKKPSHKTEATT